MKPVRFLGDSLECLREFPEDARHDAGFHIYRVIYTARLPEAVYVLHAFQKKTQATSRHEVETARERFAQLKRERK
jgi:phage-related protein